jgi:hypothetical protein
MPPNWHRAIEKAVILKARNPPKLPVRYTHPIAGEMGAFVNLGDIF